jgi:hypothetical protein
VGSKVGWVGTLGRGVWPKRKKGGLKKMLEAFIPSIKSQNWISWMVHWWVLGHLGPILINYQNWLLDLQMVLIYYGSIFIMFQLIRYRGCFPSFFFFWEKRKESHFDWPNTPKKKKN